MKKSPKTFLERLDDFPPFLVYSRSREGRGRNCRWPGVAKISSQCGLPPRTVTRIGARLTWRGIKAETISAFLAGCGVKMTKGGIFRLGYELWRMRVSGFNHLSKAQNRVFLRRCKAATTDH